MGMAVIVGVDEAFSEFKPFRNYAVASIWTGLPLSAVIPLALGIAVVVSCTL